MAGPRSISRSTKVTGSGSSSKFAKRKGKHQKKGNTKTAPLATWDHDNSDEEGPTASAATWKKRPRKEEGVAGKAELAVSARDDERLDAAKTYVGAKRRRGPDSSGHDGDDSNGSGSDGEDGGAGGRHREDRAEEDDGGGATALPTGGMGDVMARILGQKLDARVQAPVLAKRKTKAMKEMENASAKRAESRGKAAARRANMTQQFVIPDHSTTDYERKLKKIATRGVVALFNAISKRQNETLADASGGKVAGNAKAAAVKGASRHAFLDMLKTGVKPTRGAEATAAEASGWGADGKRQGWSAQGGVGADGDEGGEGGARSWSVLKEDYMMGASSMKNWDQESADSEEDALGGATNDMSGDDSD